MNKFKEPDPSEEDIIRNSKPNRLYWHEFEKGRFFQVVHQDEEGFKIKLAPRTMLKAVYIKEKDDIEGIEFIKLISEKETQKVSLNKFNLVQIKAFLSLLSGLDLKGITEKRLKIIEDEKLDETTIKQVKTLLSQNGGAEVVESLIDEGIITSRDIVNTSFRKRGLQLFERLLNEPEYWEVYATDNDISTAIEEKVWQYFFEKNEWIFGYGLDYRFQKILQREVHLSGTQVDGAEAVIGDYLLGDKRFTTFIELKKPSTKLFGKSKNRSNSWKLSSEFINSVSQILEHKASGLIRFEEGNYINGEPITQKAYDSKVVLIIGRWTELEGASSTQESDIKKKTFELFRKDSRNIETITFDELFERAKYIVDGDSSIDATNHIKNLPYESDFDDDFPF